MKFESVIPEELGIPSGGILDFLNDLEERKICMHGIMILRRGKLAFEAHYPPFGPDTPHRMYSVTKSFVAMAIGFLIDEGKITLKSKLIDFFPEYEKEAVHPFVREMTIRNLLLMATAYDGTTYKVSDSNWIKTFFTTQPTHKSGTVFKYDTSGTVALTALVEKISGQSLVEYLRPRLFDPLGFNPATWCVERPEGGSWGGSGLLACIHDLASFGLFLMNRGNWEGKQLLSSSYIAEACSPLIDNRVAVSGTEMCFGYGYQIWQTRHNGFSANGMGSQLAVCLPEKDLLLVTTADTQSITRGSDIILEAFFKNIYSKIKDNPIEEKAEEKEKLKRKLSCLEFPLVDGEKSSPLEAKIQGKTYRFADNAMNISRAAFSFSGGEVSMKYSNESGDHEIHFGLGKFKEGIFPETKYFGKRIGVPSGKGYRYKATAAWFNPESLTIYLYIIDDYLGTLKINCFFKEEYLTLYMTKAAEWFLDEYSGMATGKAD